MKIVIGNTMPSPKDCQSETLGRSRPQTKAGFVAVRCLCGGKEGLWEAAGASPWMAVWGNQPGWFHFRNRSTSLVALHHGKLPTGAPACGTSPPSSRNNGFSSMTPCLWQQVLIFLPSPYPDHFFFRWVHLFVVQNTNLEFVDATYNYSLMVSREACLLCFIP